MPSRSALLAILKSVEPALSKSDVVPVLACFAFDGKTITAFDEAIALRADCGSSLKCAVPGAPLIKLLAASGAKDAEFEVTEECVAVKCGRTKMKMTSIDLEQFAFTAPPKSAEHKLPAKAEFLRALEKAMITVGTDQLYEWRYGVTLAISGPRAKLYSSNNYAMTRTYVDLDEEFEDVEIILIPRFCNIILDRSKTDPLDSLAVIAEADADQPPWIVARFRSGVTMYARGMASVDVARFEETFTSLKECKAQSQIPKHLDRCLDRASILITAEHPDSLFKIADGKIRIVTESPTANISDVLNIEHDNCAVYAGSALIHKAMPYAQTIGFYNECIVLQGDAFRCIISVRPMEDEAK